MGKHNLLIREGDSVTPTEKRLRERARLLATSVYSDITHEIREERIAKALLEERNRTLEEIACLSDVHECQSGNMNHSGSATSRWARVPFAILVRALKEGK